MPEEEKKYREMFDELSDYERYGIPIKMNGIYASPMQVVSAHMVKEDDSTYMRDYIVDDSGHVKELCFYHIKRKLD